MSTESTTPKEPQVVKPGTQKPNEIPMSPNPAPPAPKITPGGPSKPSTVSPGNK